MSTSTARDQDRPASFAALETLEPRVLLAGDWSGAWKLTGYEAEVERSESPPTPAAFSANATLAPTTDGSGDWLMIDSTENRQQRMQAVGDDVLTYTRNDYDWDKNSWYEEMMWIKMLAPGVAVLLQATAGYDSDQHDQFLWTDSAVGLLTRGVQFATPRPWVGTYDVTDWHLEIEQNGTSFGSDTFTAQFTSLGGGQYFAQNLDDPEDNSITLEETGGVLKGLSTGSGPDWIERGLECFMRAPNDTLIATDLCSTTDAAQTALYSTSVHISVLTPQADSAFKPVAGDWSGAWKFKGYEAEVDPPQSPAQLAAVAALSVNATLTPTTDGSGDWLFTVPKEEDRQQRMQAVGDDVLTYTSDDYDWDAGSWHEEMMWIKMLAPGVAVFLQADAAYDSDQHNQFVWTGSAVGLLTRGAQPATPRPWDGTYDITSWSVEAEQDGTTFNSETFAAQLTSRGGGQYLAEQIDPPDPHGAGITLKETGGVLKGSRTETGPDEIERGFDCFMRAPNDTLVALELWNGTSLDGTELYYASAHVMVLTPQAASAFKPDLTADIGVIAAFAQPLVPGDSLTVPVIIANDGNAAAKGKIKVDLYLSLDGAIDDLQPFATAEPTINIKPNATKTLSIKTVVPPTLPPGNYFVVAVVDSDNALVEINEANNQAVTGSEAQVVWQFGQVGARKNVKLSLRDADGTPAIFTLGGPGTGTVAPAVAGPNWTLGLLGTTLASKAAITTAAPKGSSNDNEVALAAVTVATHLGALAGKTTNLMGNADFTGTVSSLVLNDVTGTITVGPRDALDTRTLLTATLARVQDSNLTSVTPIKLLQVVDWLDTDGFDDMVQAPQARMIASKGRPANRVTEEPPVPGDFQASVNLSGTTGVVLGGANIAGDLGLARRGIAWTLPADVGPITVKGAARNMTVTTAGDIGALNFGAMLDVYLKIGLNGYGGIHANAVANFFDPQAKIASLKITGLKGAAPADRFFANSNVSAGALGAVNLLNADFSAGGVFYVPENGLIKSIKHKDQADATANWTWPPRAGLLFTGPADLVTRLV